MQDCLAKGIRERVLDVTQNSTLVRDILWIIRFGEGLREASPYSLAFSFSSIDLRNLIGS